MLEHFKKSDTLSLSTLLETRLLLMTNSVLKNTRNLLNGFCLGLVIITLTMSCTEEEQVAQVVTEEAIYVSGETLRIVGRVLSSSTDPIINHGFIIDESEDFSNPITIELGQLDRLGRYIGETNQLEFNNKYFCKAFIRTNESVLYGNTININTLNPFLTNFHPKFGSSDDLIIIEGGNWSSDMEVYFGSEQATIQKIVAESRAIVKLPKPLLGVYDVPISLRVGDEELIFEKNFEYVTGKWVKEGEFFNTELYTETLLLQSQDSIYFGLGKNDAGNNNNLWSMNLNTKEWGISSFQFESRFPFSSGSYFGNGAIEISLLSPLNSNKFWFFDGTSFVSKSDTPFSLYKSISFETPDQVLVLGGINAGGSHNTNIYAYDKGLDIWSIVDFLPFSVQNPLPHFILENKLYIHNKEDNSIWRYDISLKLWEHFIDYPEEIDNGGLAVVINNKVFIGLFDLDNRIWELDVLDKIWKDKVKYPLSQGDANNGYFVYEEKLFLLKNLFHLRDQPNEPMVLWSFDPEAL